MIYNVYRIFISKSQTEAWFVDSSLPSVSETLVPSIVQKVVDTADELSHLCAFLVTVQLASNQHVPVLHLCKQRK